MMAALTIQNPVFVTYKIASAIVTVKLMGQGWMTVFRLLKIGGGWVNPKDLEPGRTPCLS